MFDPPEEIGPVRCVYSTLYRDSRRGWMRPKWRSILISTLLGLIGGGVATGVLLATHMGGQTPIITGWHQVVLGGFCGGLLVAAVMFGSSAHTVRMGDAYTYVGERGLAQAQTTEWTRQVRRVRVMEFDEAETLNASEVDVHSDNESPGIVEVMAGTYQYTKLSYRWENAQGELVFEIRGRFDKKNLKPWDAAVRDFAYAAKNVWFEHRAERVRKQIRASGAAVFELTHGGEQLEVGKGYMRVIKGEQAKLLNASEMGQIEMRDQKLLFVVRDERYILRFNEAGDLRLCKAALEQLCGLRFE